MQVWDLQAGKEIGCLTHTHPVTAMQFNPAEYLMATACKDCCVRLWGAQNFDLVDTCGPEATSARGMCFTKDGKALAAAYQDCVQMHKWEPAATLGQADAALGKGVADIVMFNDRTVVCTINGASVGVWTGAAPMGNSNSGTPTTIRGSARANSAEGRVESSRSGSGRSHPDSGSRAEPQQRAGNHRAERMGNGGDGAGSLKGEKPDVQVAEGAMKVLQRLIVADFPGHHFWSWWYVALH